MCESRDDEHNGRAVVELDERGGEVFHVHIGTGTLADEVVELMLHRAANARRSRFTREPQRQVKHVDTEVGKRTTTRPVPLREPAAQEEFSRTTEPTGLRVGNVPELARLAQRTLGRSRRRS